MLSTPLTLFVWLLTRARPTVKLKKKKNSRFSQVFGGVFSACLWVLSLNFAVLQMCVCVWSVDTHVHTQSSLSIFPTLGTTVLSLLALWCGCSFVKLTYPYQTPSWLWLVWTNSPTLCTKVNHCLLSLTSTRVTTQLL